MNNGSGGPSPNFDLPLSLQLDQALIFEEHHRALLLFWKQRRQRLEALIYAPIEEASQVAEQAFREAGDATDN